MRKVKYPGYRVTKKICRTCGRNLYVNTEINIIKRCECWDLKNIKCKVCGKTVATSKARIGLCYSCSTEYRKKKNNTEACKKPYDKVESGVMHVMYNPNTDTVIAVRSDEESFKSFSKEKQIVIDNAEKNKNTSYKEEL